MSMSVYSHLDLSPADVKFAAQFAQLLGLDHIFIFTALKPAGAAADSGS